ncbi:hypothetical protein R4282_11670 [Rhodococcus oxybenzonivorans]|uniref:hypothetical protein n=1 Tax=Rhodococcus oxybenzonivorans TaxID=1990687 RepID=UPI002955D185|nr:hypothetical protein [Rhodococcus oxybenzonivorans]MDV7353666.1 hypothetical protein [Rhodococcus oxybenzonivorans]
MSGGSAHMTADVDEDLRARLVGYRFPEGTCTIPAHESWLGHQAMRAPDGAVEELNPLWPLIIGMRGMGVSIADLGKLVEMGPQDSVMFGELEIEQVAPLTIDIKYTVDGIITDITRHHGRTAGTFDIVTFVLTLTDPCRETVATVTNSFVFIRRQQ